MSTNTRSNIVAAYYSHEFASDSASAVPQDEWVGFVSADKREFVYPTSICDLRDDEHATRFGFADNQFLCMVHPDSEVQKGVVDKWEQWQKDAWISRFWRDADNSIHPRNDEKYVISRT
jgi:hypothetical protein